MKHKIVILIAYMIFAFIACESDECKDCICGQIEPENNIGWLKDIIEHRPFCTYIFSFEFASQQYVSIEDCPGPDAGIYIFDCQGNMKCEWAGAGICNMPTGFSYDYYESHKKLFYQIP